MTQGDDVNTDCTLPPVTILIPAYNLADYIDDAIRSAIQQDYSGQMRIIVLDDGSSDETLAIAQKVAEYCPTLRVYSQANIGRAGTRNRLLELAETDLVAWLDGDDMATPCWIRQQVRLLLSNPDLVAVSGWGYAMNARGLPIGPIERPLSHDEIDQLHLSGNSSGFFQSCTMTKRSAIEAVGGYRTQYTASEDYDLWLRLAEVGKLRNYPEVHLYYRVHGKSANATLGQLQKQQGLAAVDEARRRRGLPPIQDGPFSNEPSARKSDWNRHVYWINIAMKSGNPWTALNMATAVLYKYPGSLLLWLMLVVSACDTILQFGNRTERFRAGRSSRIGRLGYVSAYRLAARLLHWKRQIQRILFCEQ